MQLRPLFPSVRGVFPWVRIDHFIDDLVDRLNEKLITINLTYITKDPFIKIDMLYSKNLHYLDQGYLRNKLQILLQSTLRKEIAVLRSYISWVRHYTSCSVWWSDYGVYVIDPSEEEKEILIRRFQIEEHEANICFLRPPAPLDRPEELLPEDF